MQRADRLDAALSALTTPSPESQAGWTDALSDPEDPDDRVFVLALRALTRLWLGDFAHGAALAHDALAAVDPADADATALARAAAGWAIGEWPPALHELGDPVADALAEHRAVSAPLRPLVDVLLTEAAIAQIRIPLAAAFAERIRIPEALFARTDHPFLTYLRLTPARVRLLAGDVAAARALIEAEEGRVLAPLLRAFVHAHSAMLLANEDRLGAARQAVREVEASGVVPAHLFASGVYVIAAYAATAQDDVATASRLVLRAAVDPDLSNLRISDRVICIEILVRAALKEGDLEAAQAWHARSAPLAEHPISASTVDRIRSRIALAEGDAAAALTHARRAVSRAAAHGRGLEVTEGELLAARAEVALGRGGDATRHLAELVSEAEGRGQLVARRAAGREIRATGRRLPPSRFSGWRGLSPRERDVALLLADGASNAQIAGALFLSPHTVRMHVSRILYAFGTPTRTGVAASMRSAASTRGDLGVLTPRQREVAGLIAAGASNRDIGAALGIGVFTVEKHVSAILHRWHLSSRAGIAAAYGAEQAVGGR